MLTLLTKLRQNFKKASSSMSPPYRGALTNFWNLYVHDKRDKNILKHQSYCFFLHQRLRYIFSPNSMQIRYFSLFEHRMKLLCRHLFYNMLFTPFWAHPRIEYGLHCFPFCPDNLNQNSIELYGSNQIPCAFEQPISSQNFYLPRVFEKSFQTTPSNLIEIDLVKKYGWDWIGNGFVKSKVCITKAKQGQIVLSTGLWIKPW